MLEVRYDVAPLPIAEFAPVRHESSDPDEPFLLGAGETRVAGQCRMGVAALRRAGQHDFVDAASSHLHALITPYGIVRTARIDGVCVTERIVTLAAPAAIVFQWSTDTDAELRLRAGGNDIVSAGALVRVAAGQTATAACLTDRSTACRLLDDVAQAFRAAVGTLAHAARAGLNVETSDTTGVALTWSKARLALHARSKFNDGVAPACASLAALLTGRPEQTRSDLTCAAAAFLPLIAARYAASTGDLAGLAPIASRLRDWQALLRTRPAEDTSAALWLAGSTALEHTLTDLGEPASAAQLRAAVKHAAAELLRRPLSEEASAIVTAFRAATPAPTPQWTEANDVRRHAWLTWAALEQGIVPDGRTAWQRLLAEATVPVRGALPSSFGTAEDDVAATALFVLTLTHGVLGIEPDAPRQRLRIAPRLVTGDSLEAHGIACGDCSVSLSVHADEREAVLRVTQETGAIPLTVVLEPIIAGPIAGAWLDGRRAQLDIRPRGTATAVPVQLVLDAERTLHIDRNPRA